MSTIEVPPTQDRKSAPGLPESYSSTGIFLPMGSNDNIGFSYDADSLSVQIDGRTISARLGDGVVSDAASGISIEKLKVTAPSDEIGRISGQDAQLFPFSIGIQANGRCRTSGMVHAMAHEPLAFQD